MFFSSVDPAASRPINSRVPATASYRKSLSAARCRNSMLMIPFKKSSHSKAAPYPVFVNPSVKRLIPSLPYLGGFPSTPSLPAYSRSHPLSPSLSAGTASSRSQSVSTVGVAQDTFAQCRPNSTHAPVAKDHVYRIYIPPSSSSTSASSSSSSSSSAPASCQPRFDNALSLEKDSFCNPSVSSVPRMSELPHCLLQASKTIIDGASPSPVPKTATEKETSLSDLWRLAERSVKDKPSGKSVKFDFFQPRHSLWEYQALFRDQSVIVKIRRFVLCPLPRASRLSCLVLKRTCNTLLLLIEK